jgi:hypothetical protein
MNNKLKLTAALLMLALATLACGITLTMPDDAIEIGETRTDQIQVNTSDPNATAEVRLEFGAGKLIVEPGADSGLITGTATYNVDSLAPATTTSGNEVTLKQEPYEFKLGGLPNVGDVENEWDLFFSEQPMELEIRAGAFDGEFEFGGMAIEKLRMFSGASKVQMAFSTPNLTSMSEFHYTSGAASANLSGLSNANFSLMKFEGGAGDYTLDFSGALTRDATVEVDAALSNVKIIVPAGVPTILQIDGSLTNVNVRGDWAGGASSFSLAGNGPTLTINVKLGAGNLELSN